jgi:hypothetical protein
MSVIPSAAFTTKGSGGFHPISRSRAMSVSSRFITIAPVVPSRMTAFEGRSMREKLSTRYFFDGESDARVEL